MVVVDSVIQQVRETRRPAMNAILPQKPGIYAIYLLGGGALLLFAAAPDLIYVGKSEGSLSDRDLGMHFSTGETGRSTLRRSVGAVLKDSLRLTAIPRSDKRTKQDINCFRFTPDGEALLTKWMLTNLEIGYAVIGPDQGPLKAIEDAVIDALKPPLNLDPRYRRSNRHAERVMALRKARAGEAAGQ